MKISRALSLLLVSAMLIWGSGAWAADDGFVPLFNGKDLSGWSGDTRLWSVERGVIVGSTEGTSISQNSFLSTDTAYDNFVLRFQVKLRNHNSGVQFRSEARDAYVMAGYQADIAEETYFGMLYEEKKRGFMPYWTAMSPDEQAATQQVVKQGKWNQFEVTCIGDRIKIVLNGLTTCDIRDPGGARSGFIGLQLHAGAPMEVRFKDIEIRTLSESAKVDSALLMPDVDQTRREKLGLRGDQFRVPEGFRVEEVAPERLTHSVINMTFDHLGRPVISVEGSGVRILRDEDGDGIYDAYTSVTEDLRSAQGLYVIGPGDYLIHSEGPEGAGLYRATDTDGDDEADVIELVLKSKGGIGEHGPHAIQMGPDGHFYVMYGNHAFPGTDVALDSPSRGLQEDFLLPRYVDPRGHANNIRAPGGTIHRLDPDLSSVHQIVAGFRNAYDLSLDFSGEIFTFDSDMEWDRGLPWFRPVHVVHAVPGGDYGWRTGSSKKPYYYLDTLPSLDDVGRGSPVGVCFYYHNAYPERFQGAFFMGDWSRGRIRVIFPERDGATFTGDTVDFVVGEPLNVTDLDVGPDGFLYFSTGGRSTHGGVYRVVYDGARSRSERQDELSAVLDQPMPRSAWGKQALRRFKEEMGNSWEERLREAASDGERGPEQRVRAIEALQVLGPQPDVSLLAGLAQDRDATVRAFAIFLLGTHPLEEIGGVLDAALQDSDPLVVRRACESYVRAGLKPDGSSTGLARRLLPLLDAEDRTQRYAARLALMRVDRDAWAAPVLSRKSGEVRHGDLEGLVALIETAETPGDFEQIFGRLEALGRVEMPDAVLLDYLRVLGLAMLRERGEEEKGTLPAFTAELGADLLKRFPSDDWRLNRELQIVLAYVNPPGTVEALMDWLPRASTQEDQVHTAYALRTIEDGWTAASRGAFVEWFDAAREFGGAASMSGYIDNIWDSAMQNLPEEERVVAQRRKESALEERREKAAALMDLFEEGQSPSSELAQMSFDELSEYLEYDPMSYRRPDLKKGELVFLRSRCANCHVFGSIGLGGGPDLSTVTSRFRRRDILESIMYPSKVVSDQYTGVDVEMKDGEFYSGMVAGETPLKLTLITAAGERVELRKRDIRDRSVSLMSIMPDGLLDTMSLGDLVALVQFLEVGSDL